MKQGAVPSIGKQVRSYMEEGVTSREDTRKSFPSHSINKGQRDATSRFAEGPKTEHNCTVGPNPYGPDCSD